MEVLGYQDGQFLLNPLYEFEEKGETAQGKVIGSLCKKGTLQHERKLKAAGLS